MNSKESVRLFLKLKSNEVKNGEIAFNINNTINSVQYYHASEQHHKNFLTTFVFDEILSNRNSSEENFEKLAKSQILKSIESRQDFLLFGYGNTNSGKTFCIAGNEENPGLMKQSMKFILEEQERSKFSVEFQVFEIYKEKIYDLIQPQKIPFSSQKIMNSKLILHTLQKVTIKDYPDFQRIFDLTQARRTTKKNNHNDKSSRSHCIFKISIKYQFCEEPTNIFMVDLAGVERNKPDKENIPSKDILNESKKINQSLATLLRCINAIHDQKFLPYRESLLTKVIFENLNKNFQITFVITFDPNYTFFNDNLRVLEFSALVKNLNITVLKSNEQFKDIAERKILWEQSESFF